MSMQSSRTAAPVARGSRLGVDYGAVRVGLAASDPDGLVATPVGTLEASSSVARIVAEVEERSAAVVYVGLPRHLSGAEGAAAEGARTYAGALATAIAPVPVRLLDERMSTVSAHQALHAAGRAGRRHRQVVDQAAAVVILQSALEAERSTGTRPGELVGVDRIPAPGPGTAHDGETTER
jgi:putative holliday junction resolvase